MFNKGTTHWVFSIQFAMLLLVAVLVKINYVIGYPKNTDDADYYTLFLKEPLDDDEFLPTNSQQRQLKELELDRKRKALLNLRHTTTTKPTVKIDKRDFAKKRCPDDEVDVVDREDHITQFLADMFVNTDNEITILQAIEPEESFGPNENDDAFFNFLAHQANSDHHMDKPSDDLTR